MTAPRRLPDCDADQAPDLPGTIRLTVIFEDGEGDTIYFDPARLPDQISGKWTGSRTFPRLRTGPGRKP